MVTLRNGSDNRITKDGRRILGRGKIKFLHDRAPAFQHLCKDAELKALFDGGVKMAAGKAPDMSHLDAGICPFIEKEVEEAGAETPAQIRAAVRKAWKKVTPEMCVKISNRVRRNMQAVIDRKGGNFYVEK